MPREASKQKMQQEAHHCCVFFVPADVTQKLFRKLCHEHSNYCVFVSALVMSPFNGWSTFKSMIHASAKPLGPGTEQERYTSKSHNAATIVLA